MAPRRGGPLLAQGMVSHPYPMAKDTQPLRTTCELCDRTFPSKDWTGHKNGKAHQEREKAEQAEETRKLAAANGDRFDTGGFTPDTGFGGGDAGSWGAAGDDTTAWGSGSGDTTNFASTNFGASNDFSSGSGVRGGGRAQGSGPGACYGCGEVGHNKRDCKSSSVPKFMHYTLANNLI
jgi:cellular nucleic acid-binding protein